MTIKLALPLSCVAALIAMPVVAQQQGIPGDEAAVPPVLKYDSAFAGYKPYREEPIEPWRDSNKAVAQAGNRGAMGNMSHNTLPPMGAETPRSATESSSSPSHDKHGGHHH